MPTADPHAPLGAPPEKLLSPAESADRIGSSAEFLRRLAREGKIKAYRVGPYIRFSWHDILAWLESQQVDGPAACRDPRRNGKKPTGRPKGTGKRKRARRA